MPFKRISINQGRQPHTPLKGTISRWRSVRGDCAEVWWVRQEEEDETFLTLTVYRVERPLLMRLEVLY